MALIRRVSFYCALTVFTALCSACSKTETPVGPSPVSPPVAVNNDTDGDGILNTVDRCPTQPETKNGVFDKDGCPDQIADLYTVVKNDVDFFWNTYFNTVLFRPYFAANMRLFRGTAFGNPCGAGPGSGPFYCNFDAGMYLDETFLESQLTRIGDFAVAVIIAHEIGHHTQNILGVPSQFSIQKELQADCLAGGWAASANIRGQLDNGDLQEGARSLFEVGDPAGTPWFAPSAHGSPAQRNQAFATGFARGAFFAVVSSLRSVVRDPFMHWMNRKLRGRSEGTNLYRVSNQRDSLISIATRSAGSYRKRRCSASSTRGQRRSKCRSHTCRPMRR